MSTNSEQCTKCNKSSFSLLLLRPSPIAKATNFDLIPLGAGSLVSDPALVAGLVPERQPTESRYVLRLLREGYVYLYIPKPPKGFKSSWLIWRVMENGDIIPESSPVFDTASYQACSLKGHNTAGMKLLEIPRASQLLGQTLWIAYSANLWNDTLKAQNGGNVEAMRSFVIGGENANALQPTAANLARYVLECRLRLLNINGTTRHDYPLCSLVGQSEALADNLRAAAAANALTKDKETALVLADPVGLATELNALRHHRFHLAEREVAKPENAHPITSLQMLDGLRQSIIDANATRSLETVSPVMQRGNFETIMRTRPNPRGWPPGTRWVELTSHEDIQRYGRGFGRVIFPDHAARQAEWVRRQSAATWSRYEKYLDTAAIEDWRSKFEKKMKKEHGTPQAKFEADWWAARKDKLYRQYFALHYDPAERNAPLARHSAGTEYAAEVRRSLTPQPLAGGPIQKDYVAELMRPVSSPDAVMLRALVGNQQDMFARLQDYFDSNNVDGLVQSRNDKLYDLSTGVFKAVDEALGPTDVKYSWLLREAFGLASMSIAQSFSAVLAAASFTGAGAAARVSIVQDQIKRLFGVLMASQALNMASKSVSAGSQLQAPLLAAVRLPAAEMARLLDKRNAVPGARASPSPGAIEQHARLNQGMVSAALVSDNLTLARFGYDPKAVIAAGAGTIMLNEAQFAHLLHAQHARMNQAALLLQEAVRGGRGLVSIDGRIGIIAGLINGVMMVNNFGKMTNSWNTPDILNFVDAFFGTAAGAAQVTEAVLSASVAGRLGQEAVQGAVSVLAARMVAAAAGAAGGWATLALQMIKTWQARDAGDVAVFRAYFASTMFSAGFTATSSLIFVGAFADFVVARGSTAAIWRAIAARLGAQALRSGSMAVFGIGLSGWGLIFLGGMLFFEGVAFVITPNALQAHLRRTRFGKGPDNFSSLALEFAALERLMQATSAPEQTQANAPQSISKLGAMP